MPDGAPISDLVFRAATSGDTGAVVDLLAADPLGMTRENPRRPLSRGYLEAFNRIDADPHQLLLVGEVHGALVAVLQLTFIPSLTYQGSWRAQIEGVRVAASMRGLGVGERLVSEAVERARTHGCRMVQLTTDKQRPGALRFYEGMGFVASHEGMKLHLI